MPHGTPDDVRREIRERIKVMGQGGGYVLAPSHELQGDVPLANMLAFIDEARNQQR
jgi:uroporphyrinogen decarboxylase